ncbi:uncharacterized protein LOC113364006, partial [Ctenocephalides felis]|uniref:uncharacterized protein LOC113364006 n=1 Tax=Ctenocephalides felis TaxID=7515 RepID=UPI000E6E3317
ACSARSARTLIALVNGGALLDYRTRDGATALHRAVEKDNLEAVRTLLELGASPNYRDCKGLTPLYASVSHKTDPAICEALLHDHATIGAKDLQGWQEVHQACRNGLVQHLEHLLAYGADMDARNASGNAPLHVCAVNARDACARLLLFRGARRQALNYSSQTPYQVAVIAGNMELAEVIRNYSNQDIVPFRGPPRYNPKRRSAAWGPGGTPLLSPSSPEPPGGGHLSPPLQPSPEPSMVGTMPRNYQYHANSVTYVPGGTMPYHHGFPRSAFHFERGSPDPSTDRPFSSASSSLGSDRSHEDDVSLITDKSGGEGSESSGVGTAGSDFVVATTNGSSNNGAGNVGSNSNGGGSMATFDSGTTVVCLEPYCPPPSMSGHLVLQRGEVIEVTATTDCGLLEGVTRAGAVGLFPAHCVQEVRLRHSSTSNQPQTHSGGGHHHQERHYSATAPRIKKTNNSPGTPSNNYTPRDVVLHRARRGFGFVLRGAKASSPLMALRPSERCPALQYLDDVDPGGAADMAGLKPGDFLLAINGTDVSAASHERVVELIRASGELVQMTVVSAPASHNPGPGAFDEPDMGGVDMNGSGGNPYHQSMRQHFATLPRKAGAGIFPGQTGSGTLGRGGPAPAPPRRDPRTTLSVGRARAKSMVAGLEGGGEKSSDDLDSTGISTTKSSSAESVQMSPHLSRSDGNHSTFAYSQHDSPARHSINQSTSEYGSPGGNSNQNPNQPRTASIRQRPCSSRITAAELEELFQRQQSSTTGSGNRISTMMCSSRFQSGMDQSPPGSPAKPRVYASVAEMKRKGKASIRAKAVAVPRVELLHRDFHSTPDLAGKPLGSPVASSLSASGSLIGSNKLPSNSWGTWSVSRARHRSVEDVQHAAGARQLPPPTHPPPPPPTTGQLVAVDVSRGKSELDQTSGNTTKAQESIPNSSEVSGDPNAVMSSFRPATSAKLYASPQDIRAVGYRAKQQEQSSNRNQVRKSQSMRDTSQSSTSVQDNAVQQQNQQTSNPYAQPIRKNSINNTATLPPPIPEPDYSMSESDEEQMQGRIRSNTNPNLQSNRIGVTIPVSGDRTHVQRIKVTHGDNNTIINTESQQRIIPSNNTPNVQVKSQTNGGTNGNGSASETSGNSNTSGSSTNSTSLAHSFSVDEIQKIRTRLKCSKSYPDDFLEQKDNPGDGEQQDGANNDTNVTRNETAGDNSSSGVSSDQEGADINSKGKFPDINKQQHDKKSTAPTKLGTNTVSQLRQQHQLEINGGIQSNLGFSKTMQRHNSLTRKQANSIALARNQGSKTLGRSAAERLGIEQTTESSTTKHRQFGNKLYPDSNLITTSSRQAVSLARLPPPAEENLTSNVSTQNSNASSEVAEDTFVPPPPEFVGGASDRVLAPPPQFSDAQGKVRIVGAVPKNGRLGHH